MASILLKHAMLFSPIDGLNETPGDVLLENDRIAQVAPSLDVRADRVIDLHGQYLSPGWIDIHVHSRMGDTSMSADACGVLRGNVAIIDAGTTAPFVFDKFYQTSILPAVTDQYVLLSGLHPEGLRGDALDVSLVVLDDYKRVYEQHPDRIKGLKIVASWSHVKHLGPALVRNAKQICDALGLPLTVHIGNAPPDPSEFIHYLDRGDVLTHVFHNKESAVFLPDGSPKPFLEQARARGVLIDVGHGSASFSYDTAKRAFSQGFTPDLMGTDLYAKNHEGPVYSLAVVMSKMLALGIDKATCIDCITARAAMAYGLAGLGRLQQGGAANLTAFTMQPGSYTLPDSVGDTMTLKELFMPTLTIRAREGDAMVIQPTLGIPLPDGQ